MDWQKHITRDFSVMTGKPCIKGTRITVDFILKLFASGWTKEKVLASYPHITNENINAVFSYTASILQDDDVLSQIN